MGSMKKKDVKILVIDDEKDVADVLVGYLQTLGYSAWAVYSGTEALLRIKEEDYQVVISDVMMPEMSGLEVLEAVKRQKNKVVVMLITGYATIEKGVEAIEKGAYDYISKPFHLEELDKIMRRALERVYGDLES